MKTGEIVDDDKDTVIFGDSAIKIYLVYRKYKITILFIYSDIKQKKNHALQPTINIDRKGLCKRMDKQQLHHFVFSLIIIIKNIFYIH